MPNSAFDLETVAIMERALDAAWSEFERRGGVPAAQDRSGIRRALALRIMAAVRVGQRDPERLRQVALHVVDGCRISHVPDHVPDAGSRP